MDANGAVYLAGTTRTSCANCIAQGGHQMTFGGGGRDAFLAKFSAVGQRLWGTYYGGPGDEEGMVCAVDALGSVYLAGATSTLHTACVECIATAGSHQPALGGMWDAFIAKFSSAGGRIWGTYYGGGDHDSPSGVAICSPSYILLAGITYSISGPGPISTPPSAPGVPHQPNHGGGMADFFITLVCEHRGAGCTPLAYQQLSSQFKDVINSEMRVIANPSAQPCLILPKEAEEGYEWQLYDVMGHCLRGGWANARELFVSLRGYPAGRYFVVVMGRRLWHITLEKPAEE
ncbi:MAG: hypothetical protein RMJ66_04500 [Bacteroidia bacterium]|nr:hypothetical protein [Bacteroidia bacterium]